MFYNTLANGHYFLLRSPSFPIDFLEDVRIIGGNRRLLTTRRIVRWTTKLPDMLASFTQAAHTIQPAMSTKVP
jgi:hypothetical protein